jgi:nicotinate-nucleotide--dimethylbenzimidazole phosphoribosyltransferase
MEQLQDLIARIAPLDVGLIEQARTRQSQLTKPPGSLGVLEDIAVRVVAISGQLLPAIRRKRVIVMAADHGVTEEGVSAYPSEVTPQMVLNFLHGGAAINAMARQAGAEVAVVDIGVAAELHHPMLISRKIAAGTANMAQGPAMTREQALAALAVGQQLVEEQVQQGLDLVATGEMGIGNTSAASAITASLLRVPVARVTGRGTGIDDQQLAHKVQIIERALARNVPDAADPLDVLCKVGGLEIAGLTGVILAAAASHIPIVIDGFISGAAALIAFELCPRVRDYLFVGHLSVESGHQLILDHMGLSPLLDLHMRLGEGTGAVLAMNIIDAAVRVHCQMATFDEAEVSNREGV